MHYFEHKKKRRKNNDQFTKKINDSKISVCWLEVVEEMEIYCTIARQLSKMDEQWPMANAVHSNENGCYNKRRWCLIRLVIRYKCENINGTFAKTTRNE